MRGVQESLREYRGTTTSKEEEERSKCRLWRISKSSEQAVVECNFILREVWSTWVKDIENTKEIGEFEDIEGIQGFENIEDIEKIEDTRHNKIGKSCSYWYSMIKSKSQELYARNPFLSEMNLNTEIMSSSRLHKPFFIYSNQGSISFKIPILGEILFQLLNKYRWITWRPLISSHAPAKLSFLSFHGTSFNNMTIIRAV